MARWEPWHTKTIEFFLRVGTLVLVATAFIGVIKLCLYLLLKMLGVE